MKKMLIFLSLATLVTLISPMITESRNQILYRQFDWQHIKKQFGEKEDEFYELWYPKQMEHLQGPTQAIIDQIYADYSQKVFTKFKWYPKKFNSLITDALKQGGSINTFSDSAETAEVWYDKARTIVIYPSMQDFTQQRLIWQMISPGVLGFNETTGWRVGIPFPGSYIMFKNVMYHELAHAWMFSFMRQSVKKQELKKFLRDRQRANFPLWFVEGFAEVLNRRYNQDFNPSYLVVMRETMMRNQITDLFQSVPSLARMAGMDVYSFGHSFVNWVVEKYGIEKIIELLAQRTRQQGFGKIWETVFNQKLVDMQIEWEKELLWYFEPFFTDSMKSVTEKMNLANKDADEDDIYFYGHVGYDQFRISYYLGDSKWYARTEVRDLFTSDVWKIHHMYKDKSLYYRFGDPPAIKNNLVALIVNQEGQDELQIYQLGKKKNDSMWWFRRNKNPEVTTVELVDTLRQKNILSIQSPSFNEDGTKIVFEGIVDSSGFSDLYLWDLKQNKVERLMQDIYRDAYPRFFKLGEKQVIAFTSDRLDQKKIGLYYLDLETKTITYLYQPETPGTFIDQLVVSPNSHAIAFRLVSIDHSPQVFIWQNPNKIYHVFNSFDGVNQVVGWLGDQTLLLLDRRGRLVKFNLDDLESYPHFKNEPQKIDQITWTLDQPDTLINPSPKKGKKYRYPMMLGRNTLGWASATGEEIFGGGGALAYAYGQLYYQAVLHKIDVRSRLQKQYTLSMYRFYNWRSVAEKNYVGYNYLIDHTIQFKANYYWPTNFENGFGFSLTSGYLKRSYPFYQTVYFANLDPGINYQDKNQKNLGKYGMINQGWGHSYTLLTYTHQSGPVFGSEVYYMHDAVFGTYGEVRHGTWLATRFNWLAMNKHVQEGVVSLDGRYYLQLFGTRALIANRFYAVKSFGQDRFIVWSSDIHKRSVPYYGYKLGTDLTQVQTELRFPILNWLAFQPATESINSIYNIIGFRLNGSFFYYAGSVWYPGNKEPWDRRAGFAAKLMIFGDVSLQHERYRFKQGNKAWSEWRKGWFLSINF